MEVTRASAPSSRECVEISFYRALRQVAHEDPFYTIPLNGEEDDRSRVSLTKSKVDPFTCMPTYSQKYKKEQRTLPRLDTRPYGKWVASGVSKFTY